ncbi:MAG: hypothetical protein J1F11_01510 [Oscillospiraceae bacterium]|nr:hypothetical protein [Oscillospiraceae bacterium]
MNFLNDRYTLRLADSGDNEGIRLIFESGGFDGGLSVQYLRGESPMESFQADGEEAKVLVIIDNNEHRTAAVGGSVIRKEYLNGKIEDCAYLTGLKVHPDYRGRINFLTRAYQLMGEILSDCRCVYTTILDDNTPVIKMLEKKRRNMPEYRYLGHYTTYCFHGGKKILPLEKNNREGFQNLLDTYFLKLNFTPADTEYPGLGEKDFYCVRDEHGEITACCFVGDQSRYKQYKMCSYGGVYKLLSKLPTRLAGYPAFPKAGEVIKHGAVSYLYVKDNDPGLCSRFLRSVAAEAEFSLLIWGGFESHPLCPALDKMKTVRYGSRLYEVVWDKASGVSGQIGMEAAVL